ncbi:MAG: cob(I)yrinic acid a,c-diamide adenosyltransferase [Phycisphaeraceae bacterium]|nr:cob(I)yrinic acid a,c-diamide adenosyltransferase [Phycisphaeraceae bacterium]
MVKLTKICTRTGDDGTTGLVTGERVSKTDIRVAAYGTVDEANSFIGVAIVEASRVPGSGVLERDIGRELRAIQNDLFDLGADLATPVGPADSAEGGALRIADVQTLRLEQAIDRWNEGLGPLRSFVLPGGTPLSAALHVARTVVRRAERDAIQLDLTQPGRTGPEAVRYLNRLSDLLFVLARVANDRGRSDVLWSPAANRPSP